MRRPRAVQPQGEGSRGSVKLYYRDERGFAPPLPTKYSWTLPSRRTFIPYEATPGHRVNALAAHRPFDQSPRLEVFTAEQTWELVRPARIPQALPWS